MTRGKSYPLDDHGFLRNYEEWDEDFAEGLARELGIAGGLAQRHRGVIRSIREWFLKTGECPLVYRTCRDNKLSTRSLKDRIINYYGEPAKAQRLAEKVLKERAKDRDVHGGCV